MRVMDAEGTPFVIGRITGYPEVRPCSADEGFPSFALRLKHASNRTSASREAFFPGVFRGDIGHRNGFGIDPLENLLESEGLSQN
jgi:hypothetical protein